MTADTTNTQARPKLPALARWALFWALFIGVGAVGGALMMWIGADVFGMNPLLDLMRIHLPLADVFFTSFTWPGVFLFAIIGLPNLTGAALVLRRHQFAPVAATLCGIILVGWIMLQLFVVFSLNPMSIAYGLFGVAQAVMGWLWNGQTRPKAS